MLVNILNKNSGLALEVEGDRRENGAEICQGIIIYNDLSSCHYHHISFRKVFFGTAKISVGLCLHLTVTDVLP